MSLNPNQLLRSVAKDYGLNCCHDGACIYGHPGGMQTNGGCQAMKERDVHVLRRHMTALRSIAVELAKRVVCATSSRSANEQAVIRRDAEGRVKRLSQQIREMPFSDHGLNANSDAYDGFEAALEKAAELVEQELEKATGWQPIEKAPLDAWVTAGKYTAQGEWVTIAIIRPSSDVTPRLGLTHFILHPSPPERGT